ncbi:MAG TPA: WYL domain-containing protein [Mycobacteriales bacterium]|nr:WYL domain-containing protein [Mycobacteriales bacterium]
MSARKTERLLNLVIALLATRRPMTAADVRRAVPGYGEEDVAFHRTFERDKEELRELGIPLETVSSDEDPGYRIARRDYELPEVALEPDEAAAAGLAARVWAQAALGEAAAWAMRKLTAGGAPIDVALPRGLQPRVEAAEPAFPAVSEAVRTGRPIRFRYRGSADEEPVGRRLEPWGVVSWRGRWYVAGQDLDRGAGRVFRLSRIVGAVAAGPAGTVRIPPGVDVTAMVSARGVAEPTGTARMRIRSGRAGDIRRLATAVSTGPDGWDSVEVGFADVERLAGQLAGYAADVVALEPPELRAAVVERLRTAAGP